MANELSKSEQDLVSVIKNKELGDMIKPFFQTVHLFDSFVAGTTHLEEQSVLESIKEGDWLDLKREDNKFDSNAIIIYTSDKKKLGYVPEKDNLIFARLMDAGKLLKARITGIKTKGTFKQISIGIYLQDF